MIPRQSHWRKNLTNHLVLQYHRWAKIDNSKMWNYPVASNNCWTSFCCFKIFKHTYSSGRAFCHDAWHHSRRWAPQRKAQWWPMALRASAQFVWHDLQGGRITPNPIGHQLSLQTKHQRCFDVVNSRIQSCIFNERWIRSMSRQAHVGHERTWQFLSEWCNSRVKPRHWPGIRW